MASPFSSKPICSRSAGQSRPRPACCSGPCVFCLSRRITTGQTVQAGSVFRFTLVNGVTQRSKVTWLRPQLERQGRDPTRLLLPPATFRSAPILREAPWPYAQCSLAARCWEGKSKVPKEKSVPWVVIPEKASFPSRTPGLLL